MEQVIRAIKDINQTDVVVAAVSAVACLGALLELPVWAVFIGWAWYLAIGANGKAIKEGAVTAAASGIMALTAVVLTDGIGRQYACGLHHDSGADGLT